MVSLPWVVYNGISNFSLLTCCAVDDSECWLAKHCHFSSNLVVQLSLCQKLPFSAKEFFVRELTSLARWLRENERGDVLECVKTVASHASLELKDKIFSEILDLLKRFARTEAIPSEVSQLLFLISRVPISGDRRVKVLQISKKTEEGLLKGVRILTSFLPLLLTSLKTIKFCVNSFMSNNVGIVVRRPRLNLYASLLLPA